MSKTMSGHKTVSQTENVSQMIEESSIVLREIVEDFEEIVKLDKAEQRYIQDERFSEHEKQRIKELKGKVMTIEEGIASKQFSNYADFINFLDKLSSHIIESIKYELIIEGEVTDRAKETKEDLIPEHRELLIQINRDALEILEDLDQLLKAIERFADRKGVESYEKMGAVITDIETVRSSISTSEKVILDEARELGIKDEL